MDQHGVSRLEGRPRPTCHVSFCSEKPKHQCWGSLASCPQAPAGPKFSIGMCSSGPSPACLWGGKIKYYLNKANANGLKGLKWIVFLCFLFWCSFLGETEDAAAWRSPAEQSAPRYSDLISLKGTWGKEIITAAN